MHPGCIFCKIIAGEIPALRILRTDAALAFIDIGPVRPGHILLIPTVHAAQLHELDDDSAAEIGRLLPRLGVAVMSVTGAEGYHLLQNNGSAANQSVFHVHFHLIPRNSGDGPLLTWIPTSPGQKDLQRWQAKYQSEIK